MVYAVSSRPDGNMAFQYGDKAKVLQNRQRFLEKNDIHSQSVVVAQNQHGTEIVVVDRSMIGRGFDNLDTAPKADALVTTDRDIALFLLTADCIPLLLVDRAESVLALVHVSWKTATLGLPQKIVALVGEKFGIQAENLRALFGPSIHKESYILTPPLEQENSSQWQHFLEPTSSGKVKIDLIGFTTQQLVEAGLSKNQMIYSPIDTAKSADFFSHYRSKRTNEPEGRFATVASLG